MALMVSPWKSNSITSTTFYWSQVSHEGSPDQGRELDSTSGQEKCQVHLAEEQMGWEILLQPSLLIQPITSDMELLLGTTP